MIKKAPISSINRMRLEKFYITYSEKIKNLLGINTNLSKYVPLSQMNRCFGHEYLLRRYANTKDNLYSIIEHGLYFGNTTSKVGEKEEWAFGNILTNGKYRLDLIKKIFPEYYCESIGPMIHYAEINNSYIEPIIRKTKPGKTMLFFPIHAIESTMYDYDRENSFCKIIEISKKLGCTNLIICSFHNEIDIIESVVKKINLDINIIVTTCGKRYNENFLDVQKSLISISDYTSSSIKEDYIGTCIGYCVYMNKPHVIIMESMKTIGNENAIREEKENTARDEDAYKQEAHTFYDLFKEPKETLTKEQYDLCDYYWGFSEIKSKEEIASLFYKCKNNYMDFKITHKQ